MRKRILVFCILICGPGDVARGVNSAEASRYVEHLGRVRFANSCSPQVQADINRAVAMLHSFQYGFTEKTFLGVLEHDSQCAIAYWGAAMALYHQLWDWPSPAMLAKGRMYLAKARLVKKKSAREQAYLTAAEAFYQPADRLGEASRVQDYSDAMRDLYHRYPADHDAAAFYALSLLTLPSQGDASSSDRQEAIQILQALFRAEPYHPGAAHYLIHATDTAELAQLGLAAARRYASIAPSSPHALHMPAHIFVRLGMWQDSIASNLASIAAAREATRSQRDDGSSDELHALMYLEYSYLQSGDSESARHVVESVKLVSGARRYDVINNQAILQALYAVETHDWKQAAALADDPSAFPYASIRTYWARAIGAARTGDIAGARSNLEKLDHSRAGMVTYSRSVDCAMHMEHSASSDISVQQLEARAWLAWAEGKSAEALTTMRSAVANEASYGVESRTVPAYEMLGDLLLELHQPEAALAAYEGALQEAPLRFNALAGAARASQSSGNLESARSYYAALVKCCNPKSERREFGEAQLFLGKRCGQRNPTGCGIND